MCGRFTLTVELSEIQQNMGINLDDIIVDWVPRFNIAPTQSILAVNHPVERRVIPMRWGLIPFWAKDETIGSRMINARGETLDEKPSFRKSLQTRRCLILADGFYEWRQMDSKSKVPYYFHLENHIPFTFAGLWDAWKAPTGESLLSCTIITCEANECVSPIHARMPVILDAQNCWTWLDEKAASDYRNILKPYPAEKMRAYAVNRYVNDPSRDTAELILPANLSD